MRSDRAEKVAQAVTLRAEGATVVEIAEAIGVAPKTVYAYFNDPDLSRQRARRERYRHPCPSCGEPMDGSGGLAARPPRCRRCTNAARSWSRAAIVAAIQRFVSRYGQVPAATDFAPSAARRRGHEWRAARFYRDGDYPAADTVQRAFGSWNAGILAAGYAPRGVGQYTRAVRRDNRVL